ncbi:MAG: response regulator [Chloroflexota bacterium]
MVFPAAVIIISHNPQVQELAQQALAAAGCQAILAGSGGEGLRLAHDRHAQLLLAQVDPPDMPAEELCRRVKADAGLAGVRCGLLFTHPTDDERLAAVVEAGADSWITLPVSEAELAARLRALLRLQPPASSPPESEKRFMTFFRAIPAAVDILRLEDGQFVDLNDAWEALTGYSYEQAVGRTQDELDLWVDPSAQALQVAQALAQGRAQAEIRLRQRGGSLLDVAWSAERVELDGQAYLLCLTQDITRARQADELMHQRVSELEMLYQAGQALSRLLEPDEIGQRIIDLLAQYLNWHHAIVRQYHPDQGRLEVLGFHSAGLSSQQRRAERRRLEKVINPHNGLSGWALMHGVPLRIDDLATDPRYHEAYPGMRSGLYVPIQVGGRVIGVITVESDQPKAFRPADEQLLTTLAAQAGVAMENSRLYAETRQRLDELAAISKVSSALRSATNRDEMLPVIIDQVMLLFPAAGAAFALRNAADEGVVYELGVGKLSGFNRLHLPAGEGLVSRAFAGGEVYLHQPAAGETVDGLPAVADQLPLSMAFVPLLAQGQVFAAIVVGCEFDLTAGHVRLLKAIADIGASAMQRSALHEKTVHYAEELEQRVAERTAELTAANHELQRAHRAKNEFLANMSHELRTPLNGILGISEVMLEHIYGPLNEKQEKSLQLIESSGQHLLGLINDVLDLSKVEAGKIDLNHELVDVEEICQASLVFVKQSAMKKAIRVQFERHPAARKITADPKRLKQVLVNLLSNAVKFTPNGGRVALTVTPDEGYTALQFTVIDNGIGISDENQARLFKPFEQIDSSLNRQQDGTGLGLALVKRLVDLHGGAIQVTSQVGQGSSFSVSLPWDRLLSPIAEPPAEAQRAAPVRQAGLSGAGASRGLILLAEDNEVNILVMSEYLRGCGYQVQVVMTGEDALLKLPEIRPQLLLMDIQMPGMDGLEAMRRIRAGQEADLAGIPIVAVTARAMPGDRELCLQAGANAYLSKPVDLPRLLTVIQELLPGG